MRKFWPSLATVPLLGVFLTGCPKPATPPQPRPPVTDSRPANSKPGGFLGQPSKTGNSRPQSTSATADEPMGVLGNPDGATASPSNKEHFLMRRPQFDLSYNNTLHFPNWVAWHLVASFASIGQRDRHCQRSRGFQLVTYKRSHPSTPTSALVAVCEARNLTGNPRRRSTD